MTRIKKIAEFVTIVYTTLCKSISAICLGITLQVTVFAASCTEGILAHGVIRNTGDTCYPAIYSGHCDTSRFFRVVLPQRRLPMPTPLTGNEKGFAIRGMKGYCWTPQQYLEEIPVLARYKANFLMNCYLSLFSVKATPSYRYGTFLDSLENDWWNPLPDKKRQAFEQIFRECRKYNINFCFAMNPQLFSGRPLNPCSEEDLETLWKHYDWAQKQGIRWFSLCLDDVSDKDVAIIGSAHAKFANRLFERLRANDPDVQLIFCPTWYWGTGADNIHHAYLNELADILHPEIYVFWTGPEIVPTYIHTNEAAAFRQLVRHRLILWDNYPVNDNHPTMHLGPLTGRDNDLYTIIDGYMSNPMGTQNQINRIPLLTCLDYAYNPVKYDPGRSAAQAIIHLTREKHLQKILARLVDTYPGSLILMRDTSSRGSVNLNPVRSEFMKLSSCEADNYIRNYKILLDDFIRASPEDFAPAKTSLMNDLNWMLQQQYDRWRYKTDTVIHALLLDPSPYNQRNSEGDFIKLNDGRILFIYTHFTGGSGDFAQAYLAGRYSSDKGKTWTNNDVVIVPDEGQINIMSVSLLRLKNGSIALFYLRKNSPADCRLYMRVSNDETSSWSKPVIIQKDMVGYFVTNNDRVIQLSGGRIIIPVSLHNTPEQNKFDEHGELLCYYSDNNGRTWHRSSSSLKNSEVILQEPGIVELRDGRLMMFCRTDAGCQYYSFSSDCGDTWSEMELSNIPSSMSPASIERIPATGDLLMVWNYMSNDQPGIKERRSPLYTAISSDEGKTWKNMKILEHDPKRWFCYTSIDFTDNHVLLSYCAGIREKEMNGLQTLRVTRLPIEWLYQKNDNQLSDNVNETSDY